MDENLFNHKIDYAILPCQTHSCRHEGSTSDCDFHRKLRLAHAKPLLHNCINEASYDEKQIQPYVTVGHANSIIISMMELTIKSNSIKIEKIDHTYSIQSYIQFKSNMRNPLLAKCNPRKIYNRPCKTYYHMHEGSQLKRNQIERLASPCAHQYA